MGNHLGQFTGEEALAISLELLDLASCYIDAAILRTELGDARDELAHLVGEATQDAEWFVTSFKTAPQGFEGLINLAAQHVVGKHKGAFGPMTNHHILYVLACDTGVCGGGFDLSNFLCDEIKVVPGRFDDGIHCVIIGLQVVAGEFIVYPPSG